MLTETQQSIAPNGVVNFTREKLKREIKQAADDINQHADQFQAIDIGLSMNLQKLLNRMKGADVLENNQTKESQLFEKIAKEEMFIESLNEQKSDSLDFHEVHVSQVSDALRKAYEAGKAAAKN